MLNEHRLEELLVVEPLKTRELARTYVGEAKFFEELILEDLSRRDKVTSIIEVGAGIGLLAALIGSRGFKVVAFEPQSAGFSEMQRIRGFVIEAWDGPFPDVTWIDDYLGSELPPGIEPANFGMAINVVEHVPDIEKFVSIAMSSIRESGTFRLICPNYAFPYEPHFNFPTLFSKSLTGWIWKSRIAKFPMSDPVNMWNDLSWTTKRKLKRAAHAAGCDVKFSRSATAAYVERALSDDAFVARKGIVGKVVLVPLSRLVKFLIPLLPVSMLPILDASLSRK